MCMFIILFNMKNNENHITLPPHNNCDSVNVFVFSKGGMKAHTGVAI